MLKLFQDKSGVYDLGQVTAVTPGVERDPRNPQQVTKTPGVLHMLSGAWHATVTDFEELVAKWKAAHAPEPAAAPAAPAPADPSSTSSNTSAPVGSGG